MTQLLTMGRPLRLGLGGRARSKMKEIPSLALLTVLGLGTLHAASTCSAEEEGVALAIVYDTSGSMRDRVADQAGRSAPKYVIANRALKAVADQIQAFATNTASGAPRKIDTGLFTFHREQAHVAIPFGPFDAATLRHWAERFSTPNGNTPLGRTLSAAGQSVLKSRLSRKHVLVITDGINTAGPTPAAILPRLKQEAAQKGTRLSVHFVAFDVKGKVFNSVKKQGATVVAAADEKQLNLQLQYILQQRILLEDEETPQKK